MLTVGLHYLLCILVGIDVVVTLSERQSALVDIEDIALGVLVVDTEAILCEE